MKKFTFDFSTSVAFVRAKDDTVDFWAVVGTATAYSSASKLGLDGSIKSSPSLRRACFRNVSSLKTEKRKSDITKLIKNIDVPPLQIKVRLCSDDFLPCLLFPLCHFGVSFCVLAFHWLCLCHYFSKINPNMISQGFFTFFYHLKKFLKMLSSKWNL